MTNNIQVWNLANCKLKTNHIGHSGYVNNVTMSPDGSLCASGGKDARAMLWDLNDGKHLYTLDHNEVINALTFSPNRYASSHLILLMKIWNRFPIVNSYKGIGSALPLVPPSRFGILRLSSQLRSFAQSWPAPQGVILLNVCLWHGLLTARLSSLDIPIRSFVSGRSVTIF